MSTEKTFVTTLATLLNRDEYLIPYVWAQRLLRRDNYQMASQALLEDVFYDTLGDYINRHAPQHQLVRRTGAEPWDYKFDSTGFSHKEGMQRLIVSKWQAGSGPKNKSPIWPTWTFTEPVTFVYTKPKTSYQAQVDMKDRAGRVRQIDRDLRSLTHESIHDRGFDSDRTFIALAQHDRSSGTVHLTKVMSHASWASMNYKSMRSLLPDSVITSDFVWFQLTKAQVKLGLDPVVQDAPITGRVSSGDLPSGVYVLKQSQLIDLPQASNNKAHFVVASTLDGLMRAAIADNFFVPLPLWPAIYTDMTPPNLYFDLRSRYDALFQARSTETVERSDLNWFRDS